MEAYDCEPWTTSTGSSPWTTSTGSSANHLVPRFLGLKIERQERQLQKKKPLLASSAPEEAGKLQAEVCGLEHDRQRRCLERETAAKMSRPLTVVFGPPCRPVERDMALHFTARDKQEEGKKKQSQDDFLSLGCSLVELVEEIANVAVEKEVAIESVTSWDAVTGAALLKTRCETSGSSYAMFWERSTRGGKPVLTVVGGYVTPARKASLVRMGMSDSYPDSCRDVVLDEAGDNMVAKALRSKEAIYIDNVASCPSFARRDKAARYGIQSISFLASAGGVIEYGTVNILKSSLHSDDYFTWSMY
jgi:hypothetical protein